uniref:Uncharacterized protein n=1 Tax=Anguilla anguilla TaxID=7936 RepID=A0A0E9XRT8_ANGAN
MNKSNAYKMFRTTSTNKQSQSKSYSPQKVSVDLQNTVAESKNDCSTG